MKNIQREQILCDIILERTSQIIQFQQQISNQNEIIAALQKEVDNLKATLSSGH